MTELPACLATAQEAKIERFLGLDPAAGIKDAITCAGSNSPGERELALLLLADIGTPEALRHIQALSHDSNKEYQVTCKSSWSDWQWDHHWPR